MTFEWDEVKAAINLRKHRIAFANAWRFEFDTALIGIDDDFAYGEERLKAYGFIGPKLYVMVYVEHGITRRVISLREATRQEKRTYEEYIIQGW